MDKVYVVQRRGVYDRGICGTADTLDKAKSMRDNAIEKEPDSHHDFHILRIPLNTLGVKTSLEEYEWPDSTKPSKKVGKKKPPHKGFVFQGNPYGN